MRTEQIQIDLEIKAFYEEFVEKDEQYTEEELNDLYSNYMEKKS